MNTISTTTYLLKDSHGNTASAVVTDASDTVQVSGMKDKEHKDLHFESEAYHLFTFCAENGIELKKFENEENFDELWEKAEELV